MRLPDGSELMHAGRPYDPAKAHEYYLRTRKLKGRKKGEVAGQLLLDQKKAPPSQKPKVKPKTQTTEQKIAEIVKKLDLLKRQAHAAPGDVQKRTKSEHDDAAAVVQAAQTKLADLNQVFKQKVADKAPASETNPLKQSITAAQEELKAATEKLKNLGKATKSG